MSVVHLHRQAAGPAVDVRGGQLATTGASPRSTPFTFTGPAAGTDLLRTAADPDGRTVLGTLGNCSGGTTPWGTVLSGEENFNGYFRTAGHQSPPTSGTAWRQGPTVTRLGAVDPRFDARYARHTRTSRTGSAGSSRSTRSTRTSPPVKHTALGRFKHEGANVIVGRTGHVVAYMGDDERFDYLYKFVSSEQVPSRQPGAVDRQQQARCSPPGACTSRGSPATHRRARSTAPGRCRPTGRSTAPASGSRS